MPDLDRMVGGLRCREVLAMLADYVEGEMEPKVVGKVEAHLRGCDHCEKFGGEYGSLVHALRERLEAPAPGPEVQRRLRSRMADVWAREGPE